MHDAATRERQGRGGWKIREEWEAGRVVMTWCRHLAKAKKHPFKQRLKGVVISWLDEEIKGRKRGRTNSFAGFGLHQPVDCKRAFGGDV